MLFGVRKIRVFFRVYSRPLLLLHLTYHLILLIKPIATLLSHLAINCIHNALSHEHARLQCVKGHSDNQKRDKWPTSKKSTPRFDTKSGGNKRGCLAPKNGSHCQGTKHRYYRTVHFSIHFYLNSYIPSSIQLLSSIRN